MNIKYITHNEIDKLKWNNCINNAANGLLYAYAEYLDAMTNSMWDALIIGEYEAVMPLPFLKKYGICYLSQPLFVQQGGVFSAYLEYIKNTKQFLAKIPKKFVKIALTVNYLADQSFKNSISRNNYILDLNMTYGLLKKKFNTNTQRNIKHFSNNLLTVNTLNELDDVFKFMEEYGKPKLSKTVYQKLENGLKIKTKYFSTEIYQVKTIDNEIIASSVFVLSHGRAHYLLSAQNEIGKTMSAMFGIIDNFIQVHADSKLILDFEGSNIEGIARFFQGWGAKNEPYTFVKYLNLPFVTI